MKVQRKVSKDPNQNLIPELHFAVAPYKVKYIKPSDQIFMLSFEKGFQVIGTIEQSIQNHSKTKQTKLKFENNLISFRLFSDKNSQYQWSIYSKIDQMEEFIESYTVGIKEIVKSTIENRVESEWRVEEKQINFQKCKLTLCYFVFSAFSAHELNNAIKAQMAKINEAGSDLIEENNQQAIITDVQPDEQELQKSIKSIKLQQEGQTENILGGCQQLKEQEKSPQVIDNTENEQPIQQVQHNPAQQIAQIPVQPVKQQQNKPEKQLVTNNNEFQESAQQQIKPQQVEKHQQANEQIEVKAEEQKNEAQTPVKQTQLLNEQIQNSQNQQQPSPKIVEVPKKQSVLQSPSKVQTAKAQEVVELPTQTKQQEQKTSQIIPPPAEKIQESNAIESLQQLKKTESQTNLQANQEQTPINQVSQSTDANANSSRNKKVYVLLVIVVLVYLVNFLGLFDHFKGDNIQNQSKIKKAKLSKKKKLSRK